MSKSVNSLIGKNRTHKEEELYTFGGLGSGITGAVWQGMTALTLVIGKVVLSININCTAVLLKNTDTEDRVMASARSRVAA
jgi:hypothetical protein